MTNRWVSAAVWVGVLGALGGLVYLGAQGPDGVDEPPDGPPIVDLAEAGAEADDEGARPDPIGPSTGLVAAPPGRMPDFPCLERSGEEMTTADLYGRYSVVDFIFTNCPGVCLPMSRAMKELQDDVMDADDVRLVSFTVDPERDSPEVLTRYADTYGADAEKWWFLFMAKGRVQTIANDHMLLGDGGDLLLHSSKFVLLDREGRVRGYYDPLIDEGWKAKVLADIDTLRTEGESN